MLDERPFSEKNKNLFDERTLGYFFGTGNGEKLNLKSLIDRNVLHIVGSHNSEACRDIIRESDLRLLINCGTPAKISKPILLSVECGILNVQPGLLPKYRRASAVEWALWNKDPLGVTAHLMSHGYDDGPIIDARVLQDYETKEYTDIRIYVYFLGIELMQDVVKSWLSNGRQLFETSEQNELHAVTRRPMDEQTFLQLLEDRGWVAAK